jgi:uncharacterized protein (DUF58 family)
MLLPPLKQLFRNWAMRRTVETGTVELTQRRIYILPSRQGLGFLVVLALMLLGCINYNLSLGYVLTFLLAMLGLLSMLYTFRNLAQLKIRAGQISPVFVGSDAQFVFHFDNPSRIARYQIILQDDAQHRSVFDLAPHTSQAVALAIPATQRGWMDSQRLTLYSEFPLGLFHAWTYLHFEVRALIYPAPASAQALPAQASQQGTGKIMAAGDEDFAGLRRYVAGDPLPRIAWKSLAREQGLQVKQFAVPVGADLWLDFAQLPALSIEQKLSLLTRWVLDADAQKLSYGLRLPDSEIAPQNTPAHRTECLRRLAFFGLT